MSISAYRWAWDRSLEPSRKLVLLALAEHCGREWSCFPSLDRLEVMSGLSRSSLARALNDLEVCGLVERRRSPGSVTHYRLLSGESHDDTGECQGETGGGVTVTRGGCHGDTGGVSPCDGGGVTVTRGECHGETITTTEPQINHHLTTTEPASVQTIPVVGGEVLIFPAGFSEWEKRHAAAAVASVNGQAQDLLDELAGLIANNRIKVGPLACLRGLVKRAQAGTFAPELACLVRKTREKPAAPAAPAQAVNNETVLRQHARLLGVDEAEYLARMGGKS